MLEILSPDSDWWYNYLEEEVRKDETAQFDTKIPRPLQHASTEMSPIRARTDWLAHREAAQSSVLQLVAFMRNDSLVAEDGTFGCRLIPSA